MQTSPVGIAAIIVIVASAVSLAAADSCVSNPCVNGATCVDKNDGWYNCTCTPYWVGEHCEVSAGCDYPPMHVILPTAVLKPGLAGTFLEMGDQFLVASGQTTVTDAAVVAVRDTSDPIAAAFNWMEVRDVLSQPGDPAQRISAADDIIFTASSNSGSWSYRYASGVGWQANALEEVGATATNGRLAVGTVFDVSGRLRTWSIPSTGNPVFVSDSIPNVPDILTNTILAMTPKECGLQFLAMAGTNSPSIYYLMWNGTNWLRKGNFASGACVHAPSGPSRMSMTCDILVAGYGNIVGNIGCVSMFQRNGTSFGAAVNITIPDQQPSDFCGSSVAVTNTTLVVGCTGRVIPQAGQGVVWKWDYDGTNPSLWSNPKMLSPYCSPLSSPAIPQVVWTNQQQFGQTVAIFGKQIVVGSGLARNGSGAIFQYGIPCRNGPGECGSQNACIESPFDPSETRCVCPPGYSQPNCTAPVTIMSSSSLSSTGTHDHSVSSTGSHPASAAAERSPTTRLITIGVVAFAAVALHDAYP